MKDLDELLKLAGDMKHITTWSNEGQDEAGNHLHSICIAPGGLHDDAGHVCLGEVRGDTPEQAHARAELIVRAVQLLLAPLCARRT